MANIGGIVVAISLYSSTCGAAVPAVVVGGSVVMIVLGTDVDSMIGDVVVCRKGLVVSAVSGRGVG